GHGCRQVMRAVLACCLNGKYPFPSYAGKMLLSNGRACRFSLLYANREINLLDMKIKQLNAVIVRIPQKPPIAPYQSRYRATSEKEAVIIRLETASGLVGWGETPVDWINKSFQGAPEELLRRQALGRDP